MSGAERVDEDTTGLASARDASAGLNPTLRTYRDDGLLAEQLWRLSLAIGAAPLSALALLGLAVAAALGWRSMAAATAGIAWFVVLSLASAAGRESAYLQWLVPAFLRAGEYGAVLWLATLGGASQPIAYGLLAAVAFHHYDLVYRLRHQLLAPPRWLDRAGLGWELRLALVLVAALAGVLGPVLAVLAAWCGALYVSESVFSWAGVARNEQRAMEIAVDDEEAEAL